MLLRSIADAVQIYPRPPLSSLGQDSALKCTKLVISTKHFLSKAPKESLQGVTHPARSACLTDKEREVQRAYVVCTRWDSTSERAENATPTAGFPFLCPKCKRGSNASFFSCPVVKCWIQDLAGKSSCQGIHLSGFCPAPSLYDVSVDTHQ